MSSKEKLTPEQEGRRRFLFRDLPIIVTATAGALGITAYLRYLPQPRVIPPQPTSTSTPSPIPSPTPTLTSTVTPTPSPTPTDVLKALEKKLLDYIPEIEKYPLAVKAGAMQVNDIVYKTGLVNVKGENYAWNNFVSHAMEIIVQLQDEGQIKCLNYGDLSISDKSIELEGMRQILLPQELTTENIKTGDSVHFGGIPNTPEARLSTGIYNVAPQADLGEKSPQQWLRDMAIKDYQDKNSKAYEEAMWRGSHTGPVDPFPNSAEGFKNATQTILDAYGDLYVFLYGHPEYLQAYDIVPNLIGQARPYYTDLESRLFGVPVNVLDNNYPTGPAGYHQHNEPVFRVSDRISSALSKEGKLLVPNSYTFFEYGSLFVKDYKNKPNTPYAAILSASGELIPIDLTEFLKEGN